MVGKEEEQRLGDEDLAKVRLITEKKRHLEENLELVQDQIKCSFERLSSALRGREKKLLRQVEAVHRQQLALVQSSSEHLTPTDLGVCVEAELTGEQELLERLLDFGRIKLSNLALAVNNSEPYKAEEYVEDVVNFDKSLKSSEARDTDADDEDVISRKQAAHQPISINLNCPSCIDSHKGVDDNVPSGSASKRFDDSPATPESTSSCSYNYESGLLKKHENDVSSSEDETEDALTNEITQQIKKFKIEDDSNNGNSAPENTEDPKLAEDNESETIKNRPTEGNTEHPVQIQQWLQQILAETETEPIIHEIGQIISKIPQNPRLYRESVET